jgi:orotate phosphoribosyltransferase
VAGPPGGEGGPPVGLTDARHARPVAAALVASGAFTADLRIPRDQWYRWKSGILAPCGCNCRRLNAVPSLRRLVECEPGTGDQAVIIEDVVASGGSAARAIRALLAETSLRVAGVQSIANWNFPEMRDLLAPWTVRAVTSYPQVLASAQEAGMLSEADAGQLLRFYADPRGHRWPAGPAVGAPLSGAIAVQHVFHFSDYREPRQYLLQFRNTYYSMPQHLLQTAGQNGHSRKALDRPDVPFYAACNSCPHIRGK